MDLCRRMVPLFLTFIIFLTAYESVYAQRQFITENAELLAPGRMELEIGFEYWGKSYNFRTNANSRTQLRLGVLGVNIGVGKIVEIQLAFPSAVLQSDDIIGDDKDVGDATFFTKVRLFKERGSYPSVAVRFGTKLPNAEEEFGIGTDGNDFMGSFPITKNFGSLRTSLDLGLGILGNPTRNNAQHDVYTFGLSLMYPSKGTLSFLSEIYARKGRSQFDDLLSVRAGLQFKSKKGPRLDVMVSVGLAEESPEWEITTGFAWDFKAFSLQ